jgi:hypothetical protein
MAKRPTRDRASEGYRRTQQSGLSMPEANRFRISLGPHYAHCLDIVRKPEAFPAYGREGRLYVFQRWHHCQDLISRTGLRVAPQLHFTREILVLEKLLHVHFGRIEPWKGHL